MVTRYCLDPSFFLPTAKPHKFVTPYILSAVFRNLHYFLLDATLSTFSTLAASFLISITYLLLTLTQHFWPFPLTTACYLLLGILPRLL